jgi:hypothetical protein
VTNDSDNQANQPQTELVAGDEMDEMIRSKLEKEGRAINFPLEATNNNQNSTLPAHMQGSINFVTTSTEKPNVMSFFDLSDVSMDHDDGDNNEQKKDTKKDSKLDVKKDSKIAEDKKSAGQEIIVECSFNGTAYKVSVWELTIYNVDIQCCAEQVE